MMLNISWELYTHKIQEFVSIPAGSEMFISCRARGMRQRQEYLVEP